MAEKRKQELVARLAAQRAIIDEDKLALTSEFNVGEKLKQVVKNNPLPWIGGATGTAALLGFMLFKPRRQQMVAVKGRKLVEVRRKRGLISKSLRLGISFVRPALARFVLLKVKDRVEARLGGGAVTHGINSVLGGPSQK